MPRTTRSSNSSKKKSSSGRDKNSTEKAKTPRKSLRSFKASLPSSVVSSSTSSVSTTASRSLRKRLPPSLEKTPTEASVISVDITGPKRRRVSLPPSPESPTTPSPVKADTLSGRKRRGSHKKSPTSPLPISPPSKRTKVSKSTTPELTPSKAAPQSERRRRLVEEGDSAAEEEATQLRISSPSTSATSKRPLAKRSRRAPRKSVTPVKNVAAIELTEPDSVASTPALDATAKEGEPAKEDIEEKQIEDKEEKKTAVSLQPACLLADTKPLSKEEMLVVQRKQLLKHLDHHDLSDLISLSSLLDTWPESELRTAISTPLSPPIGASQRLWVSTEASLVPPGTRNGDSHEADMVTAAAVSKEAREVPGVKSANRHLSPATRFDVRDSPSSDGRGEHEMQTTAETVEKDPYPVLLDTFCVASFTLPARKGNDETHLDEYERLIHEVATINPDVFCVKQVRTGHATSYLHSELSKQGYQSSGSSDGAAEAAAPFQSFIYFSREVFFEIASHRRPVQSMARKLVQQSAYPQLWRDTLSESLNGNNASDDSQLLVSVLRHLSTGSLLLVGCLTERLRVTDLPVSPPPLPPIVTAESNATGILAPRVKCGGSGEAAGGCCASVFTVSVAGCHSSLGGTSSLTPTSAEWCPPAFQSRPDLAAINAAGCLWTLQNIWQDVLESERTATSSPLPLLNGYNDDDRPPPRSRMAASQMPIRWVLCVNLEASPSSPVYQILLDGYPSDESIARLRAVRNVHLRNDNFLDATSLLDLLWHAFQHPCTDVRSCYHSVMNIEPPFTRYAVKAPLSSLVTTNTTTSTETLDPTTSTTSEVIPRKCVDYIFCSGSSLCPRQVLVPPCRAILGVESDRTNQDRYRTCSTAPCSSAHEVAFSLASKVGIVATSQTQVTT